ncbi:MAG: helicase-related protein, partial [Candidatus Kryptonium sp.]
MVVKTIPDIIDNAEHKLSDVLNDLINENSSVYIATGYFNMAGFNLVKEKLKIAKEVKILIGKAISPEHIIKPDEIESKLKEEIEGGIDDEKNVNSLNDLIEFLKKENVEVKIFRNNFYHGKFYIIDGGIPVTGSIAIVGSSNFTYAGLTHNTEYNSVIKQADSVESHKRKFLKMFNENADDYKPHLLSLLSGFTSQYKPYEIYIKILYSHFESKLSESPTEEMPSPIILADFQKDGYISALQSLEKYRGVILADSVGLGKTYLALRILDDFAYRLRQKALIICPAQIKEMIWEPKLKEFGIRADIVTQEKVSRDFKIDTYKDYDLIIIDESHNFRNSSTKRWKNLFQTIINGNTNKKVVLITATPINNTVFDLYHQLRFITKDQDDFFASAGINSLWGYFIKAYDDKETLYDLLEEIAVRRSRPFIKKYYPNALIDGKPLKFPERKLNTVSYSLTSVYSGIYDECIEAIESLTLASYNVEIFRKDLSSQRFQGFGKIKLFLKSTGRSDSEIREFLMDIGRNEAIIGIFKILLLKRLESSIFAFRESIKNLLDFQKKFLELLDKRKFLDKESYRKFVLSQSSDEEAENYLEELKDMNPDEYEIDEIRAKTEKDIYILENIYSELSLPLDRDDKLQQLVNLLQKLKNKKVVIFGQFKDTMRYIYDYITQDEILKKLGLRKESIEITDSDVKPEKRKDIITRFSPISNNRPDIKGTEKEIQILFSTDILSEGQNLQDADTVINYDLPWNPIKIVQRVGRLDRIGSPHDTIHVYNFFPEDELESLIKLLYRLNEKLKDINKSIGL